MMDSDGSSSSSSGDSEAMKEYVRAMSPKPSPVAPKAAAAAAAAGGGAATFNDIFSKAGLDSDAESSQPSVEDTSGSSESHSATTPRPPANKLSPLPSPRPPPNSKMAPPMTAFKSSLGGGAGSDSDSASEGSSEVVSKPLSLAKGFSEFLEDHEAQHTKSPSEEESSSRSGSSRSSRSSRLSGSQDDSRSQGQEGDQNASRAENYSQNSDNDDGGSSRTPSQHTESKRSTSSRGLSRGDSESRSSRRSDGDQSSRSRGSQSPTGSQSESRRSRPSSRGSSYEGSMASPNGQSDNGDRSDNDKSPLQSENQSSKSSHRDDANNESRRSNDSGSHRSQISGDPSSRSPGLLKPGAEPPSVVSPSTSKSQGDGGVNEISPRSPQSVSEKGSRSDRSARSRSAHSGSVSQKKTSLASPRSHSVGSSRKNRQSPNEKSLSNNDSDADAKGRTSSTPKSSPLEAQENNSSSEHGKTESDNNTTSFLPKINPSAVPKSPHENTSDQSSGNQSIRDSGSKVSNEKPTEVAKSINQKSPEVPMTSRPSILQRLEARRRAFQNQTSARSSQQESSPNSNVKENPPSTPSSQGSSTITAPKTKENKSEEIQTTEEISSQQESPKVQNEQIPRISVLQSSQNDQTTEETLRKESPAVTNVQIAPGKDRQLSPNDPTTEDISRKESRGIPNVKTPPPGEASQRLPNDKKTEETLKNESRNVHIVPLSLGEDVQRTPDHQNPDRNTSDEARKLDSQSEDYDPRKNDADEWKALVRRSAKSSTEQQKRQKEAFGDSKHDENDSYIYRDARDGDGWMPPPLTTYREKRYSPENSKNNVAPTKGLASPVKTIQDPAPKHSAVLLKKNVALFPPVTEIEVTPPPEDESSLGSMGFLFPKGIVPELPREQIVTHKLKPTVAGVDYDQYKSWVIRTPRHPPAQQTRKEEFDREDPPGTTTIFKPERVIRDPIAAVGYPGNEITPLVAAPILLPESPRKLTSETWAPARAMRAHSEPRSADEWEAWKLSRMEAMHASQEQLSDTSQKKSPKSDNSSVSTWAPPTRPRGSTHAPTSNNGSNSGPVSMSTWLPPSQTARVDFSGEIRSQPTSSARARSSGNGPSRKAKSDDAPPVVDVVCDSSHYSSSSESTSTSSSSSRRLESKNRPSSPENQPSGHRSSGKASSESRCTPTSGDTGALFRQPQDNTTNVQAPSPPQIDVSTDMRPDIEQGTSQEVTAQSVSGAKRFSGLMVVLVIFLSILAIGGIITAVVLILTNRAGNEPTPSPDATPVPSSPAETLIPATDDLKAFVISASPSSESSFNNPLSAESKALDWLSTNQFLNKYSDERKIQRFVLAVLFFSTGGDDSWSKNSLWLSDIDECDWYFSDDFDEVCNSDGALNAINLKDNNLAGTLPWAQLVILAAELLILDLKNNSLSGPIGNVVGDLKYLRRFDIQGNQFTGTIPATLGELTDATEVDISENRLTGRIPPELSSMTSVQSLWLNDNLLSGDIPSELGRLSDLRNMYLTGNNFVGSMPEEICGLQLDNLEVNCEVECSCCTACGEGSGVGSGSESGGTDDGGTDDGGTNNGDTNDGSTNDGSTNDGSTTNDGGTSDLSGDSIYELILDNYPGGAEALANSTSPQSAAFQWVKSSTNVTSNQKLLQRYALASLFYATDGPRWITTDSWLSKSDECFWYTTAETGIFCDSNGNVMEINLRNNNLQGSIPMELILISNTLAKLDLEGNDISGSISSSVEGLRRLEEINLSSNSLFGVIPSEIGYMTNLRRLALADNNLFSTIPPEIGLLGQLEFLDLGSNQLTGSIPGTLGSIQSLAGISLYKNLLSGTFPSELSNLSNLQLLYADENNLIGPIPASVCQLGLEEFWSDCEETQCTCCTTCCSDGAGCT